MTEFKRAFKEMIATSQNAYKKTNDKYVRNRTCIYSREEIDRIVASGNPIERAQLSEHFFFCHL